MSSLSCRSQTCSVWANVGFFKIWKSQSEKLIGIVIDRFLNFNYYALSICIKADRELSAFARTSNFLDFQQRIVINLLIEAQFNYKLLTWMFHGHKTNQKLNHLQERKLQVVYNDQISIF